MNTNRLNNIVSRQRSHRVRDLVFALLVVMILAIQVAAMWQVRDVSWVSAPASDEPTLVETLAPATCIEAAGDELVVLPDGAQQC